jgi:membrane-associated phospholipid phosphatase
MMPLVYLLYFLVRAQAIGSTDEAFRNANHIISAEKWLGIFWEVEFQNAMSLSHDILLHLWNIVWFYGHWPLIIVCAIWLFVWRPQVYSLTRNAFFITGGIALIIYFLFPAVPRHYIEDEVVYTLTTSYVMNSDKSTFVNPFAPLPSMHVGWNFLIATGLFLAFPGSRLRYLFFLLPVLTWISTVATGSHYIIDGFAGICLALFGLYIAVWVQRNARQLVTRLLPRPANPGGASAS